MSELDYPQKLEGGSNDGALLLGLEEDRPVYWNYQIDQLVYPHGVVNEPPFGEDTMHISETDRWVGEYIHNSRNEGLWTNSTRIGEFLASVAKNEDTTGMLGERQAVVYALCELADVSALKVSRALDISVSTVYNTNSTAEDKLESYREVLQTLSTDRYELRELLREGMSNSHAIDYWMTAEQGYSLEEWASERGAALSSVTRNVREAKRQLPFEK